MMPKAQMLVSVAASGMCIYSVSALVGAATVERPSCGVQVEALGTPKRVSVPAGTVFHVCPDDSSAVDRKIAIPANVKLTGEFDGWLEYEFRPGVPVYAKNPRVAADGAGKVTVSGEARAAESSPSAPAQSPPGRTAASPGSVGASSEIRLTTGSGNIVTATECGHSGSLLLYVDEDFEISDDLKTKQAIWEAASTFAASCKRPQAFRVKILPMRALGNSRHYTGGFWATGFVDRVRGTNRLGEVRDYLNWEAPIRAQRAEMQAREEREASARRSKELEFVDFLKKNGVQAYADAGKLVANPFVFEGKTILVEAQLISMLSKSEVLFEGFQSPPFVVTKAPPTRFTEPDKYYSLAVRVEGMRARALPGAYGLLGDGPILHLTYVGASDMSLGGSIVSADRWTWYEARINEAKGGP